MANKPFRDTSSGVGLDVVVTLPAPVVVQIEAQANERGETAEGWCRAELVERTEGERPGALTPIPREELVFDMRMASPSREGV